MVSYRDIPDFPGYRVSDNGLVLSCKAKKFLGYRYGSVSYLSENWHYLKATKNADGYMTVALYRDSVRFAKRVSVLILEAFVEPRPAGMEACHENGNRSDDRLSNLRWDTAKRNHADKFIHGTNPAGEKNPAHVLTARDVKLIRERINNGESDKNLGNEFGVHSTTIRLVRIRKTWKHI